MTSRTLAAAIAALTLSVTPALAAPAQEGAISASTPEFKWDGGPMHGAAATAEMADAIPCDAPSYCEDTLINVETPGTANFKIEGTGAHPNVDVDLYVYQSDPSGAASKEVGASTSPGAGEAVATKVSKPGHYLLRVKAAVAVNVSYTGVATLKVAAAPAPPAVAAPAAPAAKPAVKFGRLKAASKKATLPVTVSGSGLSNVVVHLLKGSKRVATAKVASLPVGTTKVTFKLKRKLARGGYKLKLSGKASDGSTHVATGKAKV